LFAEDAAGHPLPVYGRRLFDQVPTTFAPMDRVPVPADYVLGPGDELRIRVWGKIDLDSRVTVDRNGQIFLPKVGTFNVAGLHYEQIEGFLHTAIGHLYKDFELNVTMGQLRSIQIFVLGSARQPGAYTVGSLSTLVDALFASGGPSATGTMRRIELRRGGRLVTEFDIYDLLRKGDKSHDVQLLPGDVIYIPPVGPQVAIMGSVNEPGIYELTGEETVASALKGASGLTSLAAVNRVLLERIENHRRRRVDEFPLDASELHRVLHDGDMLRIFPISPQFDNAVTLRGNVAQPGRFPWHEGMRVSDLIPSRETLITRNYWNQQNHLFRNLGQDNEWNQHSHPAGYSSTNDNGNQQNSPDWDQANQYRNRQNRPAGNSSTSDYRNQQNDRDWNQQNSPSENVPPDVMTDISRNSAEINWAYAAIERLDEHDLSTRLIAFNLGNAIDNPTSSDNHVLKAGDVITIFSRKDLPLPMDKHAAFVRVAGEVNAPGVYRIHPGESLRDVVELAGGLTSHSYLYASQLTRLSTRLAEKEQLRLSINQMQRDLLSGYAAAPSIGTPNPAQQQAQQSAQQALIAKLSAVSPTGRIVLDMKPDASTVADIPAFPLEDGDSFYIPPRMSTIQVVGAIYNENAFRYQSKKPLSEYLNDAGGPTRQADAKRIYLIRADGTVVSRRRHNQLWHGNFEKLTLQPGDAIVVPEKITVSSKMNNVLQATQLTSQTALTAAALSVIH